MKRTLSRALGALLALLLLMQAVPFGRDHRNPPVTSEPAWDSPRTRELAQRACFDCHSNQTRWPGYASIAPVSWLIQNHVTEGRQALNFSTWPGGSKEPENAAKETREVVMEGEMPPWDYALMHTESRLTQEEKQALVRGLQATLALANSRNPAERDGAVSARSDGDDDGEERKKPRRR